MTFIDTLVSLYGQSGTDTLNDLDQNDQNDHRHIEDDGLTAGVAAHEGHGTQTAAADAAGHSAVAEDGDGGVGGVKPFMQ